MFVNIFQYIYWYMSIGTEYAVYTGIYCNFAGLYHHFWGGAIFCKVIITTAKAFYMRFWPLKVDSILNGVALVGLPVCYVKSAI